MRITLVVAVLGSACGSVASAPDATGGETPRTYKGNVPQTSPVMFGGGPAPACTYTATLKQLDVDLAILPSGQVQSGSVQALYVEGIVMTCQYTPADPSIMNFTLASAVASAGGATLTFQEKAGDTPGASLVVDLSPAGAAYGATLTFHRTDLRPPLDWKVVATASLLPQ